MINKYTGPYGRPQIGQHVFWENSNDTFRIASYVRPSICYRYYGKIIEIKSNVVIALFDGITQEVYKDFIRVRYN